MSRARFEVFGRLDGVQPTRATVTIDRAIGLFVVRPLRRRRMFALPLATVAAMAVARVIKAEVAEQAVEKGKRRRSRRRIRRGMMKG